jgi:hypothetical protein
MQKSFQTWLSLVAVIAVAGVCPASAQGVDDLDKVLDPQKSGKRAVPAKKNPAKTPIKAPQPARSGAADLAKPRSKTRAKSRPKSTRKTAPQPRGGIWVSGRRYQSLDDYLYGVWSWRNQQSQVLHIHLYRNNAFLAFNTFTQVRVFGRFWTAANRHMHIRISRICRFRNCRPPPRQLGRSYPTYPRSTNVVQNGNERWTRIRRY